MGEQSPLPHFEAGLRADIDSLQQFSQEVATVSTPFDYEGIIGQPDTPLQLPQTSFAGFLNHYVVGNCIAIARVNYEGARYRGETVDTALINTLQRKAVDLLSQWVDPERKVGSFEREICAAFLEAARSFHWARNFDHLARLNRLAAKIAIQCSPNSLI